MRDPHVKLLVYRLETGDAVYENPEAIIYETDKFRAKLEDGTLSCYLKAHYSSENGARKVVTPLLRAWEIKGALDSESQFTFSYQSAEVIDRKPAPSETDISIKVTNTVNAVSKARVVVSRNQYPGPPRDFELTPDVESLWYRYQGYLDGKEGPLTMAYFCLTVIQSAARGDRTRAAKKYSVSKKVLDALARICSEVGDYKTARKVTEKSLNRELSQQEIVWIKEVIKMLILRTGHSNPAILPQVTMADLPHLEQQEVG